MKTNEFKNAFDGLEPQEELKEKIRAESIKRSAEKVNASTAQKRPPLTRKSIILRTISAATALMLIIGIIITPMLTVKLSGANKTMRSFNSQSEAKRYIVKRLKDERSNWRGSKSWGYQGLLSAGSVTESTSDYASEGENHSVTNNQVDGVSESDIVHTDGKYIYSLSYYNLVVTDVRQGAFEQVMNIEYNNFFPSEMFLLEDEGLLVVLGGQYEYNAMAFEDDTNVYYDVDNNYIGKYWYSNTSVVKVYDIAALFDAYNADNGTDGQIAVIREFKFKNTYYSGSRMIDGKLYLVLSAYNYYRDGGTNSDDIWLPSYYDSLTDEEKTLSGKNIYGAPDGGAYYSMTVMFGVDILKEEAPSAKAYFGSGGTIYASKTGFYIAYSRYDASLNLFGSNLTYVGTGILRFEIDGIHLKYSGNGKVDGSILNQFAMDEYTYSEGEYAGKTFFRIAATDNGQSYVTVFDKNMKKAGVSDALGKPGERIYSVRFKGEKAVIVTYFNMDPLYVLDLSKPAKPQIISELEIPGVSDYLHFLTVKDDYVFAVGRKQSDSWGLNGIKVSLFDISGTEAAREVAYYEINDDPIYSSSSEATYNHKAVMYFKPSSGDKEVFAVPVNQYGGSYINGRYIYGSKSALYYYVADKDGKLLQTKLNYSVDLSEYHYDSAYYSYSYYYRDSIRRSVISGEYVYLIGQFGIQRYNTNDFSQTEILKIDMNFNR